MNSQATKTINKTLILKLACMHRIFSRLDLHNWSGLSKMTVTNLVCEFMEAGIMRMAGTESAGVGRKAELIEVVPDSLITIGVLLTHHGLIVAGVGLDGTQYQTEHMVTDAAISLDELYGKICRGIDGVIRALPGRNFGGIVISTLGCVDSATNTLELQAFYPNVGRVTGLDKLLGEKYGMTVISENDANVAALAELYYSPQPTPQTFIYVQIDEGIGSGLITEGKLFSEANSFAREPGHMPRWAAVPLRQPGLPGTVYFHHRHMRMVRRKDRQKPGKLGILYGKHGAGGAGGTQDAGTGLRIFGQRPREPYKHSGRGEDIYRRQGSGYYRAHGRIS